MTRYREHREVYTRDFSRWSVYPKTPRPEEYKRDSVKPGTILTVEIVDVDEKGRGVAYHNNRRIKINGGATVGDKVKVKIVGSRGEETLAEIVEWL